jgi:hypothetical protein
VKKFWVFSIAVAALGQPACSQKVLIEKPNRQEIIHVQTSLNHLTVLEMNEPVSTVAVGSSVFKVEWRENKVFIEPTEPDVATNLFVWTPSGRFNYELDPAGVVPAMVFAIDQPALDPPQAVAADSPASDPPDSIATELLFQAKPVRIHGSIPETNQITVNLKDSLERNGEVIILYTIRNETSNTYVPGSPQAVALKAPRYHESLYELANSQLSPKEAERLKFTGEVPLVIAESEVRASRIEPGQETSGVVAIMLPAMQLGPKVLQLRFPASPSGPVNAILVL